MQEYGAWTVSVTAWEWIRTVLLAMAISAVIVLAFALIMFRLP